MMFSVATTRDKFSSSIVSERTQSDSKFKFYFLIHYVSLWFDKVITDLVSGLVMVYGLQTVA